jgi:hypothetical protein
MGKFIAGFLLGVFAATYGFQGLAVLGDKAVTIIQAESKQIIKSAATAALEVELNQKGQ